MSETEVIQQEHEVKKKKKKLTKEEIEKRKKKMAVRKRLRSYITPINYKVLRMQVRSDSVYKALVRELRVYERTKLIFNLLIKAWFNSQNKGQIKCKFGLTRKAAEVGSKINIVLINKYHFIIHNLDDFDWEWAKCFGLILERQFSDHRYPDKPNCVVTRLLRNRFIIEKASWNFE